MDFDTAVVAIVAGMLIAQFIGFIGNRMYEVVLMLAEDNAAIVPIVIGGVGWLATIFGGLYIAKVVGLIGHGASN